MSHSRPTTFHLPPSRWPHFVGCIDPDFDDTLTPDLTFATTELYASTPYGINHRLPSGDELSWSPIGKDTSL